MKEHHWRTSLADFAKLIRLLRWWSNRQSFEEQRYDLGATILSIKMNHLNKRSCVLILSSMKTVLISPWSRIAAQDPSLRAKRGVTSIYAMGSQPTWSEVLQYCALRFSSQPVIRSLGHNWGKLTRVQLHLARTSWKNKTNRSINYAIGKQMNAKSAEASHTALWYITGSNKPKSTRLMWGCILQLVLVARFYWRVRNI